MLLISQPTGRRVFALIVVVNIVLASPSPFPVLSYISDMGGRFLVAHGVTQSERTGIGFSLVGIQLLLVITTLLVTWQLRTAMWSSGKRMKTYLDLCSLMAFYNTLWLVFYIVVWIDND
jgi:hypothetical protein